MLLPLQFPNRKSLRLKKYDYSQQGVYFITICCYKMKCWFGIIELAKPVYSNNESLSAYKEGKMVLNEYGLIAQHEWSKLPERYKNIELEIFQIMPNHMHGILILHESKGNESVKHAPTIGEI